MKLDDIKFPIYGIRGHVRIHTEGDISFVETNAYMYILDDRTFPGSYAKRRMQIRERIKSRGYNLALYPLAQMYEGWWQVFASKKPIRKYIDSSGYIFEYKPSAYYKVKYLRVKKQKIIEGSHTILFFEGELTTIKIPRPLPEGTKYCGLVRCKAGVFIVDISSRKKKDTHKKL